MLFTVSTHPCSLEGEYYQVTSEKYLEEILISFRSMVNYIIQHNI